MPNYSDYFNDYSTSLDDLTEGYDPSQYGFEDEAGIWGYGGEAPTFDEFLQNESIQTRLAQMLGEDTYDIFASASGAQGMPIGGGSWGPDSNYQFEGNEYGIGGDFATDISHMWNTMQPSQISGDWEGKQFGVPKTARDMFYGVAKGDTASWQHGGDGGGSGTLLDWLQDWSRHVGGYDPAVDAMTGSEFTRGFEADWRGDRDANESIDPLGYTDIVIGSDSIYTGTSDRPKSRPGLYAKERNMPNYMKPWEGGRHFETAVKSLDFMNPYMGIQENLFEGLEFNPLDTQSNLARRPGEISTLADAYETKREETFSAGLTEGQRRRNLMSDMSSSGKTASGSMYGQLGSGLRDWQRVYDESLKGQSTAWGDIGRKVGDYGIEDFGTSSPISDWYGNVSSSVDDWFGLLGKAAGME